MRLLPRTDQGAGTATIRKPKKLSYREQKEWGTDGRETFESRRAGRACQDAMQIRRWCRMPPELQARSEALVEAG